ncbi:MAG TPA: hypothetical protein VM261_25665 [Kofleriaceae bacterium]|nr:hypothetical protein [Kofleriaceae bacterium]
MRTALVLSSLLVPFIAGGCGNKSAHGPTQTCGDIAGWHVCTAGAVQDGDHARVSYTFTRKSTAKAVMYLDFALWTADKQRNPMDRDATNDAFYAGLETCSQSGDDAGDKISCVVVFQAPAGTKGMYAEVSNIAGEQVLLAL